MTRIFSLLALLVVLAAPAGATPPDAFDQVAVSPEPGAAVPPAARFVDAAGRDVRLGDFLGDVPVVLAPVYYTCPNICGITLAGLVTALAQMPLELGRDYRLVAYSLHPGDRPGDARATRAELLRRLGVASDMDGAAFLTLREHASRQDSAARRVGDALGFRYAWDAERRQYAHAAGVFVLSADGGFKRWLSGVRFQPTDLRLALLSADDEGRIDDLAGRALMLCYRYDPETGRYTALIEGGVRLAGGVTALALLGFIGLSLWRERRSRW